MKIEFYFFAFVAVFIAGGAGIYWFTSHEAAGTALLLFTAGLGTIISSYLYLTARRFDGERPEDRPEAEIAEGAGEVGFFSPMSWWPLPSAFGAAVCAVGIVYGWWIFLGGACILLPSLGGLIYEYYIHPADAPGGANPSA